MRMTRLALAAGITLACPVAALAAAPPDLKDPQSQASYAIGRNLGTSMKDDGVTVDPAIVARGIRDAVTGAKPAMSEQQLRDTMTQLQSRIDARRAERSAQQSAANRAAGAAFLKAN